jgi:hypothetical protein
MISLFMECLPVSGKKEFHIRISFAHVQLMLPIRQSFLCGDLLIEFFFEIMSSVQRK